MKSKVALAIILTCIIIGIASGSYIQATSGAPTQTFTLTLNGTGYNKAHQTLAIGIKLTGTRTGALGMVVNLWVKGGDVTVSTYGTFPVSAGYGALIQEFRYIWMWIKINGIYGGYTTIWYFGGKTKDLSGKNLPVSFFADQVILPLEGNPYLNDVHLTGTLTLN